MSMVDIKVPDIGDFKEVAIIELLVKPGDTVKAEQSLITVESDKASMEIPAPMAGVIREMKVRQGDRVSTGSLLLLLEPAPLPPVHRPRRSAVGTSSSAASCCRSRARPCRKASASPCSAKCA